MADENMEILENRISSLENVVFGTSEKDALYPKVFIFLLYILKLSLHKFKCYIGVHDLY
jgi:hypothetical protein